MYFITWTLVGLVVWALITYIPLAIARMGARKKHPQPPTDLDKAWADIEEMRLNH